MDDDAAIDVSFQKLASLSRGKGRPLLPHGEPQAVWQHIQVLWHESRLAIRGPTTPKASVCGANHPHTTGPCARAAAGPTAPERQLLRRSFCLGGAADRGQTAERAQLHVPRSRHLAPARLRRVVLATLSRVVASRVVAELRGGPVAD